jgi:molecular chaperone GrpE
MLEQATRRGRGWQRDGERTWSTRPSDAGVAAESLANLDLARFVPTVETHEGVGEKARRTNVRVPIVDRRSSRRPGDAAASSTAAAPPAPDSLTEAVLESSMSEPRPEHASLAPAAGQGERLTAERDEWRDRCLRLAAELENTRRLADQRVNDEVFRRDRERLERWLELGDALDRARAQAVGAPAEWRQGLETVARLFDELMAKAGARRIDTPTTFDPQLHEALGAIADPAQPDGAIYDVCRAGWLLGERLLRPVGVMVVRNRKE